MRVPTYDNAQVAPKALPGARESSIASPALFGAEAEQQMELGGATLKAGLGLGKVAEYMQDRENADMLFRAETTLKDDYIKFEQAIKERRGQSAWGATKDAETWFGEQEKKHSELLQNDTQRKRFSQSLAKIRTAGLGAVSGHESTERRKSLEEAAQASIVGSINLAAAQAADGFAGYVPGAPQTDAEGNEIAPAPGDPITGLKGDIIKRVQVMAALNGWSPERRAMEESKYLTSLHKQVLQSLVNNSPSKAKEYYDTYKNEIDGSERDGIDRFIKEGTLRGVAQSATDNIMSRGLGLSGALSLARQKYKGDEEDEITRRIKERFSERESAIGLGNKQAADAAWKIVANGGTKEQIPPALWTSLKGEEQMQFVRYFEAKAAKGDKEGKDDFENLAKVETMIERGDITNKAELAKYEPFFSNSTLKTLATKIDKRGVVSPSEMKRVYEERLGQKVNPARFSEVENREWMAFQDYMLENVRETKRPEDMDVWADRWFMKGYGKNDAVRTNDPNTLGEARTKGRTDFVIKTPTGMAGLVDQSLAILQKNGVQIPKDKKLARDEFYTKNTLEADRWAVAHGAVNTPDLTAAYALLKQNKKPITPANMDYVLRQLKK